jgi:hypothetical protein
MMRSFPACRPAAFLMARSSPRFGILNHLVSGEYGSAHPLGNDALQVEFAYQLKKSTAFAGDTIHYDEIVPAAEQALEDRLAPSERHCSKVFALRKDLWVLKNVFGCR